MSVEYNGKEYKVKKKDGLLTLDLSWKKIENISDIKGLNTLTNLEVLNLWNNRITEIKGLDALTNLEVLNLRNNKIKVIKGLDNLQKLRRLDLANNVISHVESFKYKENLRTFSYTGNPLSTTIYDTFGNTTIQNFIEYNQMSNEDVEEKIEKTALERLKKKSFFGYQFPISNPSLIKKSRKDLTFTSTSRNIKSKIKINAQDYEIIPEIEQILISKKPSSDYKEKVKKWKAEGEERRQKRIRNYAIGAIIIIIIIVIGAWFFYYILVMANI